MATLLRLRASPYARLGSHVLTKDSVEVCLIRKTALDCNFTKRGAGGRYQNTRLLKTPIRTDLLQIVRGVHDGHCRVVADRQVALAAVMHPMVRMMVVGAGVMDPMTGRRECGGREPNKQSHDDGCRN